MISNQRPRLLIYFGQTLTRTSVDRLRCTHTHTFRWGKKPGGRLGPLLQSHLSRSKFRAPAASRSSDQEAAGGFGLKIHVGGGCLHWFPIKTYPVNWIPSLLRGWFIKCFLYFRISHCGPIKGFFCMKLEQTTANGHGGDWGRIR